MLVVEDDPLFAETVEEFLGEEGYLVDTTYNGKMAQEFIYYSPYDLYILDVKLPDRSGFELLEELREGGDDTPAIFLTSKRDGVKEGFLKGADDYVVKPVDLEELLLRIKALLRRVHGEEIVEIGEYAFDVKRLELKKGEEFVDLGLKELRLLELFVKNRRKSLSKEQIFDHLWKPDEIASDGALRVYVNNLKKIFGKEAITNIRGYGYRFEK
ncbi:MAG: response regulator transcription factor [Epsilonproteobacteria bacterium]|nr:DNA-binding response regulator [Campylobacterota bacterium]NPA57026.1 response regulator transcription factor [Campylobacterota bacterium]